MRLSICQLEGKGGPGATQRELEGNEGRRVCPMALDLRGKNEKKREAGEIKIAL